MLPHGTPIYGGSAHDGYAQNQPIQVYETNEHLLGRIYVILLTIHGRQTEWLQAPVSEDQRKTKINC